VSDLQPREKLYHGKRNIEEQVVEKIIIGFNDLKWALKSKKKQLYFKIMAAFSNIITITIKI
jgi:hypothetical protein